MTDTDRARALLAQHGLSMHGALAEGIAALLHETRLAALCRDCAAGVPTRPGHAPDWWWHEQDGRTWYCAASAIRARAG